MQIKFIFVLLLLVVIVNAQKGAKRPKPPSGYGSLPSPGDRKLPPSSRPSKQAPRPINKPAPKPQIDEEGYSGNGLEENEESGPEPPAIVPQTSFTCEDKPYNPGMYADMEVDCTVYHMCFNGRKESFLCGTGTMFNQEILSCDHPAKVKCAQSPNFYEANTELGKPGAEPSNINNNNNNNSKGYKSSSTPNLPSPPSPAPGPTPSQTSKQPPRQPSRQPPRQSYSSPPAPRPSSPSVPKPSPAPKPAPKQPNKTSISKSIPSYDDSEDSDEIDDSMPDFSDMNSGYSPTKYFSDSQPRYQPKPSKTNFKPEPRRPAVQPKKSIEQIYLEPEPEERKVRRAFRIRF